MVVWSHAREVSPWMRRLSWLWPHVLRDVRFAAVSPLARRVLVEGGLARLDEVEIVPNPIDPGDVVGEPDGHDGLVVGYLDRARRTRGSSSCPGSSKRSPIPSIRWLVFADQHPGNDPDAWERAQASGTRWGVRRSGRSVTFAMPTPDATSCSAHPSRNRSAALRRKRC